MNCRLNSGSLYFIANCTVIFGIFFTKFKHKGFVYVKQLIFFCKSNENNSVPISCHFLGSANRTSTEECVQ